MKYRSRSPLLLLTLLALLNTGCSIIPKLAKMALASEPKQHRRADTFAMAVHPNIPAPTEKIRPNHPRLLVTLEDFTRIRDVSKRDPLAIKWLATIQHYADTATQRPPLDWSGEGGATIELARNLQQRITHLACMYRLNGDPKYSNQARDEMFAAARAINWDGNSFLITAETTASMAIGYDWLFDALSDSDKKNLRAAIISKGLSKGRDAYDSKASWTDAHHNWNLVCNAGMMLGAIAIHDEDPKLAKKIIAQSRESVTNGFQAFAPDGGWEEGPTYWNYATRYAIYLLASLQTSMGVRFTERDLPGFSRTGDFRIQTIGPTHKNFNFADSGENPGISPQLFWIAKTFDHPEYAAYERQLTDACGVMDLLWYTPPTPNSNTIGNSPGPRPGVPLEPQLPTAALFRGPELATFRGSWSDPNTTFIATKAGSANAHHGHLDLGSFVLDALGQRFAPDLGTDNYALPGYSEAQRFVYYRCRNQGHNTLTLNDHNQSLDADCPITAFHQSKDRSHAVMDLTTAYTKDTDHVRRGIALLNRTDVLIQDEIDLKKSSHPTRLVWTMHTQAAIAIDPPAARTARLTLNGQTLTARILSPKQATFESQEVEIPSPQNPAPPNLKKLTINLSLNAPTTIIVQFTPATSKPLAIETQPLSRWTNDSTSRPPPAIPDPIATESKSAKKKPPPP